jgi:hypothetical protein
MNHQPRHPLLFLLDLAAEILLTLLDVIIGI